MSNTSEIPNAEQQVANMNAVLQQFQKTLETVKKAVTDITSLKGSVVTITGSLAAAGLLSGSMPIVAVIALAAIAVVALIVEMVKAVREAKVKDTKFDFLEFLKNLFLQGEETQKDKDNAPSTK